jgi:hypothetical protein
VEDHTQDATEEYDGSTWTNSPASMNTARGFMGSAGAGTQTAALAFGGLPLTGATEEYNGASWATSPGSSLNTPRQQTTGAGIQAAALAFGGVSPGTPTVTGATEEYDGTSWTSNPTSLSVVRYALSSSGTQGAALAFGGKKAPTFQWINRYRRMDRFRSRCYKNNYSKLTGGKYGTYKNIHRS